MVVRGLIGTFYSLKSATGGYLRHRGYQIWVDSDLDSEQDREDATFKVEQGLAGVGITLRSVNFDQHFLRHSGFPRPNGDKVKFNLWVSRNDRSESFKKDATFTVEHVKCWKVETGYRLRNKKIGAGTLEMMKDFCADYQGKRKCVAISCRGHPLCCSAHWTTEARKENGAEFETHVYVC